MRTGEGFLLVYSITSRNSFSEINALYQQILRVNYQDDVPAIIVANKCDLEYERQVGVNGMFRLSRLLQAHDKFFQEGRELARHLGCKLIETSAKVRQNVDEAFSSLIWEIRKYNNKVRFNVILGTLLTNYIAAENCSIGACRYRRYR